MLKAILPHCLAFALAAGGTAVAGDFFGLPDKTKPATATPTPATPAPAAPATPSPATPTPAPATPAPAAPATPSPAKRPAKGTPFGAQMPGAPETPLVPTPLEPSGFDPALLKTAAGGGESGTGTPFRDLAPAGAFLVGFNYTLGTVGGKAAIASLRPLYQSVGSGKKLGDLHGLAVGETIALEARPGYAVSAIEARGNPLVEGFQLTFMKVKGAALDPADSYQSAWVGISTGSGKLLNGEGQPIAGLFGYADKSPNALGLLVRKGAATARSASTPGPVVAATPAPGLDGNVEVFASGDDEYVLYLNGKEILSGTDYRKVEKGKFAIAKGDVLTAVVKNSRGGEASFSLRVVRDGKTVLDAGDLRYGLTEPPSWKVSRMMTGFREPKVWSHEKKMGGDSLVRAIWGAAKDAAANTLYFKGLVP